MDPTRSISSASTSGDDSSASEDSTGEILEDYSEGNSPESLPHDFNWLRRDELGSTYTSYSQYSDLPATSFDFGAEGFSGSCNYGGELLQITAPFDSCGIMFARGDFEYSLYSCLARAQRSCGGKSSFGLKIAQDDESKWRLGVMTERGCFNYRWPFNEYLLQDKAGRECGTCAVFSCVKAGTLYQVMKLESRHQSEGEVVLTIDGPMRFHCMCSAFEPKDCSKQYEISGDKTVAYVQYEPIRAEMQLFQLQTSGGWQPRKFDEGSYRASIIELNKSNPKQVILATFSIRSSSKPLEPRMSTTIKPPVSEDFYKYAGINPTSGNATGAMWRAIFLEREQETYSSSELSEVCLIARCLENILHVDLVPTFKDGKPDKSSMAVVSNVFLWARLDLKALFWKLRFLVKVHNFLLLLLADKRRERDAAAVEAAANAQLKLIHNSLESALEFLVGVRFDNNSITEEQIASRNENPTYEINDGKDASVAHWDIQHCRDCEESDFCYIMIAISYVIHSHGEDSGRSPKFANMKSSHDFTKGDKNVKDNSVKASILRWYYFESTLSIFILDKAPAQQLTELRQRANRWKAAAKIGLAAKISAKEPYSAYDELIDRLAFLSRELELKDSMRPIVGLARGRIKERRFTRFINPGQLHSNSDGYTCAPWEVHALCHHGRLLLWEELKHDEVEAYRRRFCKFLTSEATLVPSWERTNLNARRGWLRSEASCVLASTLLDICQKEMGTRTPSEFARAPGNEKKNLVVSSPHKQGAKSKKTPRKRRQSKLQRTSTATFDPEVLANSDIFTNDSSLELMVKRQIEVMERLTSSGDLPPPVDWMGYRPPNIYHPESFFNSLDDSPHLYSRNETKKVNIPSDLKRYLSRSDKTPLPPPSWTMDDAGDQIKPEELSWVSVVDLRTQHKWGIHHSEWDPLELHKVGRLHLDSSGIEIVRNLQSEIYIKCDEEVCGVSVEDLTLRLYSAFLGKRLMPSELELPRELMEKYAGFSQELQGKLRDESIIGETYDILHKKLLKVLLDSLVDQEVQYRFIFLQRCSPELVRAFVYMWHTESLDCFNAHFSNCARFECHRKDDWLSWITLRYWSLEPEESQYDHKRSPQPGQRHRTGWLLNVKGFSHSAFEHASNEASTTGDDDNSRQVKQGISLPGSLEIALRRFDKKGSRFRTKPLHRAVPMTSSIILSTNPFGDFGKCSIVSEIISEPTMANLCETAQEVWQMFIHQSQTGRCLIFLLFLGATCEAMAAQYDEALSYFVDMIKLDTSILSDDLEWTKDEDAILLLRLVLWGLESLHRLRDSLEESLRSIEEARTDLMVQINDGPGKRHKSLEKICQGYVEAFEKQWGELKTVDAKIERKIDLNCRYRDAMFSVLGLEDNQTSLRQNSYIQRLTFLTIGYLPLGFTAALFSIPDTQSVVLDSMGVGWFIGIIIIMSAVTIIIAVALDEIRRLIRRFLILPWMPIPPGGAQAGVRQTPERVRAIKILNSSGVGYGNRNRPDQERISLAEKGIKDDIS